MQSSTASSAVLTALSPRQASLTVLCLKRRKLVKKLVKKLMRKQMLEKTAFAGSKRKNRRQL